MDGERFINTLTEEQQRNVKECIAFFTSEFEMMAMVHGKTVALKAMRDTLQKIEAKEIEAKIVI